MATGPSEYKPTTSNPKRKTPFMGGYYDDAGNKVYEISEEKFIDYALNGNSFISPMFGLPHGSYYSKENYSLLTFNGDIDLVNKILKLLPENKRCIGFNFVNGNPHNAHINDNVIPEDYGITGLGRTYGAKQDDLGSTNVYGYYSLWPDNGISLAGNFWKTYLDYTQSEGVTIDSVMFAQEFNAYNGYFGAIQRYLQANPRAQESWRGLSGFIDIFNASQHPGYFIGAAWGRASYIYSHHAAHLAYADEFFNRYPDGVMSNYLCYNSDPFGNANHGFEDNIGNSSIYGLVGNGSAVGTYGMIRLFDREVLPWSAEIHYLDPYTGGGSVREHTFDQYTTTGAWISFFTCITEMRMAKRNAKKNPLTPWITNVSLLNAEYNIWTTSQETIYQAPPEVLHDTWYRKNIHNSVYGYAGFVGFTSMSPRFGYYGVVPGFLAPDGSTSGIRIDTRTSVFGREATPNAKCELKYYYNGLCAGSTYTFSYYVDLSRGYTNLNANFTTFDQPNRLNGTTPGYYGITFSQTLPLSTGPFYGESPIYFDSGNSGWTKIEFKFNAPENNTTLATTLYSVTNHSGNTGRETFIWNIQFEKESSPSNIGITFTAPYIETDRVWRTGPPIGFSDVKKGYNPKQAAYLTQRGGNSGYYYEFIKHACLLGSRGFGYFNATNFIDHSVPGTISVGLVGSGTFSGAKSQRYFTSGKTGYLQEYKNLDDCIRDVHNKINGHTIQTANDGPVNWSLPYVANGAPDATGLTWWWRVTVKPGFTMNCHGVTLHAPNNLGAWVSLNTSDEDVLAEGITWQEWPRHPRFPEAFLIRAGPTYYIPNEPETTSPTKDLNFKGMTSLPSLVAEGFTFSRGSSATYVDSNGFIKVVGPNEPRFTYHPNTKQPQGLLLERGSTNELSWSETFATTGGIANNWSYLSLNKSLGSTAPSGVTSAVRLTATRENGILLSTTPRPTLDKRSFSIWLRGITGNEKVYYTYDGGSYWIRVRNISKNWKRYDFGYQQPDPKAPYWYGVTAFNHQVGIKIGKQNQQIEVWGAQLEPMDSFEFRTRGYSEISTSYIPTKENGATRAKDNCQISGVSFTNWFGQTYGTVIFEHEDKLTPYFDVNNNFNNSMYWEFGSQTIAIQIRGKSLLFNSSGGQPWYAARAYWNTIFPVNVPMKTILSYSPSGLTLYHADTVWSNNFIEGTTQTNFGTYNRFVPMSGNSDFGKLRRFRYWNTVIDDELAKNIAKSELPDPYKLVWNPYDTDV